MFDGGGVAAVLACLVILLAPAAAGATPAWTTYHHDVSRSGIDPDSTSPGTPSQVWQGTPLDGAVYGEPLVYGSTVYVATENDTVYALNSANGAVIWHTNLGTAVPATQLPCGDIEPTVGVTSTPVIDPSTGRIYVVADTWDGSHASSVAHQMYGLNLSDGSVGVGPIPVDPPGSTPTAQLQRASLALDAGNVIIGYGGNYGDCGSYHGWLVSVAESGGALQTFEVDAGSGQSQGAIWGSGNAPAIDSAGDIWISTGNGTSTSFGNQESVIKLDSNLTMLDYWAPSDWSTLDSEDRDLGSTMPLLLPDGLVFEIGKEGTGYLLNASNLGHIGGGLYSGPVCPGSWGGGIYYDGVIYVACADGMHALVLNTADDSFAPLSTWSVDSHAVSPPIEAGGLIWSANYYGTRLYGLNPMTGAEAFVSGDLNGFEHFATPSAGGGMLFVVNNSGSGTDQVTAFQVAAVPASAAGSPPAPAVEPGQPASAAPAILHLRVSRVRGKLRLKVTLSEPGEIRIVVWRLVGGRIRGGRCHAYDRHGRRCEVWTYWLSRHRNLAAGPSGLRLRMRPLPPGDYLVTVTAIGPGGRSRPHTVQLTIAHRW